MTKQEQQDANYERQGFHPDKDYEYPDITEEELQSLQRLAQIAKKEKGNRYIESLVGAQYLRDFGFAFANNPGLIRTFALRQHEESPDSGLPDKNLLDKLEKIVTFEGTIDFIINQSGEIRQDISYEPDGDTVKPGWIRLYLK